MIFLLTTGALDFLIINHMEPDHTGALRDRTTTSGCPNPVFTESGSLIKAFYKIEENVQAVADGQTLDLGGRR